VLPPAICWAIGTLLTKLWLVPMAGRAVCWLADGAGRHPDLPDGARFWKPERWTAYSGIAWGAVLYNATICFVFCYWAWNTLVRILPAGISGLSTLMIPVVGVFSSMWMLGEQPRWPEFAALALVATALGLILKPAR
jgi:Integral membrane protein DUF6.